MYKDSRLVDIGGRRLFTRVSGNGPTVVLNGGGGAAGTERLEGIEGEIANLPPSSITIAQDSVAVIRPQRHRPPSIWSWISMLFLKPST
jgi:hypothetical protein